MQIVELKHGDYSAKVNVSLGANCFSLRNEKVGANILREPENMKDLGNSFVYGIPVLFPVNRVSGAAFEFEGRTYKFPVNEARTGCFLHGVLNRMPFEVKQIEEDMVLCEYEATKEAPYLEFPHAFRYSVKYTLTGEGLEQMTEMTNLSSENMPLLLGFHTTFNVPFLQSAQKEDQLVMADIAEEFDRDEKFLPTGKILEPDELSKKLKEGTLSALGQPISRHYRSGESGLMTITDKATGISVVYENSSELAYRLIYNGDASSFICLEPQTCIANAANAPFEREEVGFTYVKPGETKRYVSKISLKYN